jgi:hypothetical protein
MYKLFKHPREQEITAVIKTDDNGQVWSIPFDPNNTDYQAYLKWVADGNTPLPAENT